MTAPVETAERPSIAAYVGRIVAEAPPLSDEQRARLSLLLRPSGGGR